MSDESIAASIERLTTEEKELRRREQDHEGVRARLLCVPDREEHGRHQEGGEEAEAAEVEAEAQAVLTSCEAVWKMA